MLPAVGCVGIINTEAKGLAMGPLAKGLSLKTKEIFMKVKLTLAVLLVLGCFCSICVQAQTEDPKREAAQARTQDRKAYSDVHVVFMHLQNRHTFDFGVGSRVGYDFTQSISVETEVNLFPENKIWHGGKKEQGFLRVKVGKRFDRVGFFAKAGPGFMIQSKGDFRTLLDQFGCSGDPNSYCFEFKNTTSFTGDVGGVFEVYPSKRTFFRFDAGSMILAESGYHNNFQTSSGFGVRF